MFIFHNLVYVSKLGKINELDILEDATIATSKVVQNHSNASDMAFQGQTRLQVNCCVNMYVIFTSSGIRVWCYSELGFGATGVWDLESWAALCKNSDHAQIQC